MDNGKGRTTSYLIECQPDFGTFYMVPAVGTFMIFVWFVKSIRSHKVRKLQKETYGGEVPANKCQNDKQ